MSTIALLIGTKPRMPIVIEGDATLLQAAQLMTKHKIGSVLILGANDKLIGIFTERDYMRITSEMGAEALSDAVCRRMTRGPITCRPNSLIANVEAEMSLNKFRHMPVVVDDKVVGIVSAGDITKHRVATSEHEAEDLREYVQKA